MDEAANRAQMIVNLDLLGESSAQPGYRDSAYCLGVMVTVMAMTVRSRKEQGRKDFKYVVSLIFFSVISVYYFYYFLCYYLLFFLLLVFVIFLTYLHFLPT